MLVAALLLAGCSSAPHELSKQDACWARYDGASAEFYARDVVPLGDNADRADKVYAAFMLSLYNEHLFGDSSAQHAILTSGQIFDLYKQACSSTKKHGDISVHAVVDNSETSFSVQPGEEVELRVRWLFGK